MSITWPFVLRSTLNATHTTLTNSLYDRSRECERLREQTITLNARCLAVEGALERQNARYDTLLEKYHALKVTGATDPGTIAPRPQADALDKAMAAAMAGLPPELRRAAQLQLAQDRRAIEAGFLTEDDVLRKMRRGVSLEGVPAGGTLEDVVS